ncbi:MAG: histidine phosphatase family protein [Myxococcales bacterium]|nr:histidine phosphatase family protein [Myxococcales bacterium]
MRHAKSDHSGISGGDHRRPLSDRGQRDCPRVGKRIAELGWVPDLVVSSDSQRTIETWEGMADEIGEDPEVRFTHSFYLAGLDEIQEDAKDWPEDAKTVMVLGHNPGWENALAVLAGKLDGMTTGNAALLKAEGDSWYAALHGEWELEWFIRPRDLA